MSTEPAKDLDQNFAANVRQLREQKGWSQSEFIRRLHAAGLTNFHPTTVSRMEKGERPVRAGEAQIIAEVLGTFTFVLLGPPRKFWKEQRFKESLRDVGAAHNKAVDALVELLRARRLLREQEDVPLLSVEGGFISGSLLEYLIDTDPSFVVDDAIQRLRVEEDIYALQTKSDDEFLRRSIDRKHDFAEGNDGKHPEEA